MQDLGAGKLSSLQEPEVGEPSAQQELGAREATRTTKTT